MVKYSTIREQVGSSFFLLKLQILLQESQLDKLMVNSGMSI